MPKSAEKMREVSERIFHAAMELFQEKGYEYTSVAEITRKAGVSKGTFFTHFPSKDAIFGATGKILVEYMAEEAEAGLNSRSSTREILRNNIQVIARWCEDNRAMMQQVLVSGIYKPAASSTATPNRVQMSEILVKVIRAGQEKGDIAREIEVEDIVSIIMGAFFTVMYDWIDSKSEWSLEEKMNDCLELVFMGISP